MKKSLVSILVALLGVTLTAMAQQVPAPEEQYTATLEPSGLGVSVHWNNGAELEAQFGRDGAVINMVLVVHDVGYEWPTNGEAKPLGNVAEWQKAARQSFYEFKQINSKDYGTLRWEVHPYTYMGKSVIIGDNEIHPGTLVFVRTGRMIAVPETSWKSPLPKVNDKLLVGQDYSGKYFFSPSPDGKLPIELIEELSRDTGKR